MILIQKIEDILLKVWMRDDLTLPYFLLTCVRLTLKYKKFILFPFAGQENSFLYDQYPREMKCKTSRLETTQRQFSQREK